MKKIQLGRTDLHVTTTCLGTMTFGEQNTEAEAHAQLDYAVECGINFIDTAEMYPVMPKAETQGRTEQYIGNWLSQRPGMREKLVIATKAAGPSRGFGWIRGGKVDFDRKNLMAAIDTSLQRLKTDYIDLYQLHWPNRNAPIFGQLSYDQKREWDYTPINEQLEVLGDLVKSGKVRHIGVSNETPWGVSEFIKQSENLGLPRIATIQNAYNLINRSFEQGLDETCSREQVSLLAYSPLAFGRLTGKYADNPNAVGRLTLYPATWSPRYMRESVIEAEKKYTALARAHGLTTAQMSLAWCHQQWQVASTIIGATNLAQLKENIDAADITLSDEVLKAIAKLHAELPNPAQ